MEVGRPLSGLSSLPPALACEEPRARGGTPGPSIPSSPLRKKRLPTLSTSRHPRETDGELDQSATCLCPPLAQLPPSLSRGDRGRSNSRPAPAARESSRRSARSQRDALQDVSEVYQASGRPPSRSGAESRPNSRVGRPPSRTGYRARPRTAKSLERTQREGRGERSCSRERRKSATRSSSLERSYSERDKGGGGDRNHASSDPLPPPTNDCRFIPIERAGLLDREERGSLARVMEEPPSPSPMLRTLVIESALPQIAERANISEQTQALSQLLHLDFENRDAIVCLQRLTERGLAFVRDLSDYAEVLGVPSTTILQQIMLTRLDVDDPDISSSGGPLTGISRSAYVETFEKEDILSLQEEARYLSSALSIDLNSKAALPRARSSLANCAALLSAVWDASEETGRSGAELLREWARGRKAKAG